MRDMTREDLSGAFAGESQAHDEVPGLRRQGRPRRVLSPRWPCCSRPSATPSRCTP